MFCPHCRVQLADFPALTGQIVTCPQCDGRFGIPRRGLGVGPPPNPIVRAFAVSRLRRKQRSEFKAIFYALLASAAFVICVLGIFAWQQADSKPSVKDARREPRQVRKSDETANIKQKADDNPYWASPNSNDPLEGMDAGQAVRRRLVHVESLGGGAWMYVRDHVSDKDSIDGQAYYHVDALNRLVRTTRARADRIANDILVEMPRSLGAAAFDAEIERLRRETQAEENRPADGP